MSPSDEQAARPWRRGQLRGWALPGFEEFDPAALPWDAAAAKRPLPDGVRLAKRSRSRIVLAVAFANQTVYVKRGRVRSVRRWLSSWIRGDKMCREWHVAHAFAALGVRVPQPVLYASEGVGRAYLATRALPDSWTPLADWFHAHGLDADQLDALADYTRWLHALPAYHDDYRTDHIYRTDAPDSAPVGERFALIDLDGAHAGRPPSPAKRREALVELFVSLLRESLTLDHAQRFTARYAAPGLDPAALFAKARHLYDEAKGKKRRGSDR